MNSLECGWDYQRCDPLAVAVGVRLEDSLISAATGRVVVSARRQSWIIGLPEQRLPLMHLDCVLARPPLDESFEEQGLPLMHLDCVLARPPLDGGGRVEYRGTGVGFCCAD